jgi:hypothetical protein
MNNLLLAVSLVSAIVGAADKNFSGVILLAKDGNPILTRAWGDGIRTDTKFNLGSINKIFTQVAIGQLAAAGKLELTDTIRKHLPDYPSPVADKITIQQLIEHRSGLGDFFGPEYLAAPPSSIRKLSDYVPLFVNKPLEFEPGTSQRYSNAGYIVLGLIIEAITRQSYYDYVREHVTFFDDANPSNRATPITKRGDSQLPGRGSSAGGGYATAADLLRFARALRQDKLLSKKWTDWVFRGDPSRNLGVAGGSPGVNTVMLMGSPYTLIVLSNLDPPTAEEIARVARPLMGMPQPAPRRVARHVEPPDEVLIHAPVDLPMTFAAGHVPVIEAKINGKGPFRLAVDTGFGGVIELGPELAKQFPPRIDVDIDTAHFGGVDVVERPKLIDVDGIIGLNFFSSLVVTFDYPKGRFGFRGGSLPQDAMPYTTEHGVPTIAIDVNGKKFNVDIDSGSPAEVTLPLSAAKDLTLAEQPRIFGHAQIGEQSLDVYGASLQGTVRVGSIVLTNPRLDFLDRPVGNLGYRFLQNLVITFDPKNRRVKFGN